MPVSVGRISGTNLLQRYDAHVMPVSVGRILGTNLLPTVWCARNAGFCGEKFGDKSSAYGMN